MNSKSTNERKDETGVEESVNTHKTTTFKKMIFHTETFPQSPCCLKCKRYKCDCKKIVHEPKKDSDPHHSITNNPTSKIPAKIEKAKRDIFLGNKRKTEADKHFVIPPPKKHNPSENEDLLEKHKPDNNILDLNLLYNSISPPSELNEELNDDKSSSNPKKIRKSTRIKKEKTHVFQIFYCHQCKKSDNTLNMLICTNPACRDAYCIQCLKKYYIKAENTNENIKNKLEEEKKDWICYMCKGKCTCKSCNKNCEIFESNRDNEKSNEGKNNKKSQPVLQTLPEEEKKQNIVKIDDYVIYENEGPEDDDSDITMNIDYDNDEDFTEKSRKIDRRCKIINKNGKKKEKIIQPISKMCLICSKDRSGISELLNFKSIEEFLNFLKKTYESNDANSIENEEYDNNKNAFNDYFKNYHKHYSNDYVFKTIKYICRPCFNHNLTNKNGFHTLFTALHISLQPSTASYPDKKAEVQLKPVAKSVAIDNKMIVKENNNTNITSQIKPSINNINHNTQIASGTTVSINKNSTNDSSTMKLMNDLTVKKEIKDVKQIESCEKIELNIDNKKNDVNNANNNNMTKVVDMMATGKTTSNSNNPTTNTTCNNSNPLLKFLNMMNQNPSNTLNNPASGNVLMNNSHLNPMNTSTSAPQMPYSSQVNNNNNINSLVNMIQNIQNNPQLPSNPNNPSNMVLQQVLSMNNNPTNQNLMNNPNIGPNPGQQQNLNHITNNIGKLVEIISQYNQKHLNQNASMLSNINNLVNTMSNIVPLDNKLNSVQSKLEKNENAHHDSMIEITGEKKDNKVEILENNNNNENIINFSTTEEKKDLSNLLLNFDNSKNNLSSYMFNVLDELKKQIYSIQYYSLVQKLFISYIFKNLDVFIEQLANNQALNNINSNNMFKGVNSAGVNGFGENMNSLSDQLVLLKKIAENLAVNQMNNPLLNPSNIDELNNLFGGQSSFGHINQLLTNSFNTTNPSIPNANSLLSMQNTNPPSNNLNNIQGQINSMNSINTMKNPLQSMNTIFNKDSKNMELNTNTNNNNTTTNLNNPSNNPSQNPNQNLFPNYNNNMLEQLLKGMKGQQPTPVPNHIPSNPSQGQIIMPISIETNSTNIIQNPASQMFSLNNAQQQQPSINSNPLSNINNNNMTQNSLLLQLNSLMNSNGTPQGFSQSSFLNNPNLMNLLLQNNNYPTASQYPNNNNNNNQKF